MVKQVAGTILFIEQDHSYFLVRPSEGGRYDFYSMPVADDLTPLATILSALKDQVGIQVEQLRLSDLTTAVIEEQNVSLFVFDHLIVDDQLRKQVAEHGLAFVRADDLRNLFANVRIEAVPFFNAHLK